MHTQTHNTPRTVQAFVQTCATLSNDEIYELFENEISEDLRSELYSYSRPYTNDPELNAAGTHTFEPCRDAMITLGQKYNIQNLIDY